MADFPYTQVTGKVAGLLAKIRSTGVPPKANGVWLKTVGFTSSNDASLVGVLKFVGFIDSQNVPQPLWKEYRGANYKAVLGDAIKKSYAELYAVYPDAHARSNVDLGHVFSTSSSAGQQVIQKTVNTFKALVAEAEFDNLQNGSDTNLHAGPLHAPPADHAPTSPSRPTLNGGPALHIDIQIHISADSTPQQIEKIFESMSKHLYGRKDD